MWVGRHGYLPFIVGAAGVALVGLGIEFGLLAVLVLGLILMGPGMMVSLFFIRLEWANAGFGDQWREVRPYLVLFVGAGGLSVIIAGGVLGFPNVVTVGFAVLGPGTLVTLLISRPKWP